MSRDRNLCPECGAASPCTARSCRACGARLVLPARGAVAFWRLGEVSPDVLKGIARKVGSALGLPSVIQPALLDPMPSRRPDWRGVSATAFLNQVHRRASRGVAVNVGITAKNIVPGAAWNFLFGYAYLNLSACVASLHPISTDKPNSRVLIRRAVSVILHEIGHTCGLDHHDYEDGSDCLMTADTDRDSLKLVDAGCLGFCRQCRQTAEQKLRGWRRWECGLPVRFALPALSPRFNVGSGITEIA